MTLTYELTFMTKYSNALAYNLKDRAKCVVSVLYIRIDMTFIDIHRQFIPNERCLKSSNYN